MQAIYRTFPQSGNVRHRVHASIAVIGKEWQRAAKEGRAPDLRQLTVKGLNAGCANTAVTYPDWPTVLSSTDLSRYASEQPSAMQWWAPAPVAENSGARGGAGTCLMYHTSIPLH